MRWLLVIHVANVLIVTTNDFSRRRFLSRASALALLGAAGVSRLPSADAQGRRPVGTVVDYAAGVPSGRSVRAAGHLGAVRYVSQRRPGADWMLGKPVSLKETRDFAANGLWTASVYQLSLIHIS